MSTRPIRTLIVEDVEDDASLLVLALKRSGFDPSFMRVDNRDDLVAALDQEWDIVFSDYTMPEFDGMDALEVVRERREDLPFIFISGTIGEDRAVEAVKSGAQDYVIKGQYKRLPVAVNHALEEARMKREHRRAQEKIDQLINIDILTHTATRGFFLETLIESLEHAKDAGEKVGIFFINVNNFRSINDGIGIKAGDALIVELARRLSGVISDRDLIARLYADQFAIAVPGISVTDADTVPAIVKRLLDCFTEPFLVNRYNKKMTGSVGYCLFPDDGSDLQQLIGNATLAQSHAKRASGSSFTRYNETFRQDYEKRIFLENELEQAIHQNEFLLHFQPQLEIATRRMIGVESLVRWIHPRNGVISPMEFIPVAEETGLILPLGNEICRLACRQIAAWKNDGLPPVRVAVNISTQQFQQEGFAENLKRIIEQFGVDPASIELEITETALMSDDNTAFATMTELSRLGISIALDDFGTGYSSLSYLDRFPIDVLKIDRTFVADLPFDRRKAAIVHAIIAMAEKLDVKVVAEGIENAEQLQFLEDSGCDVAQGFFIQRPAEADAIRPLLQEGTLTR
ncbi:MAG TPA: EAL domain-containing protein [Gammaproteobacteria bacterium]